jgi:PKD repeat protein
MAEQEAKAADASPKKRGGWLKAGILGVIGLGSGVVGTYATAVVDRIARPPLPVANFAANADGLTLTCQNHATGESGWWDFGDGSPLEPFDREQQAVSHTYSRPGAYTVKLTVRNFMAEENSRTVQVEAAAAAKDAPKPLIESFAVQPVSPVPVAPATFRITADVKEADQCLWDLGDGRLEVAGGGKIDRLVTFEKPGSFPIQLVALNGKSAAKQASSVKVESPKDGTLMAVLKVTDSGKRVERHSRAATIAVAAPKEKASPAFTKSLAARPGYTIVAAAPTNPSSPGVKNLKIAISPDRRSASVSGEWAGGGKEGKTAGSDLLVPMTLTEERTINLAPASTVVSGVFMGVPSRPGVGLVPLPLPPAPANLANFKREMTLEVRQFRETGPQKPLASVPLNSQSPPGKPLWASVVNIAGTGYQFEATREGDTIQVTYGGR